MQDCSSMSSNHFMSYKDVYYRVTGYGVSSYGDGGTHPYFYIYMHSQYSCRTFEEAEKKVKELSGEKLYCFFIHEIPFGVPVNSIYSAQRVLSYTGDGELNAERCISDIADNDGLWEMYWGRDPHECQFAPGDIVEVFRNDCVTLEIIAGYPPSREFVADRQSADMKDDFHFDYSDDCYVTLDGDAGYMECHNHVPVVNCFPAKTFVLEESISTTLKEAYNNILLNSK